jgi:ABC-type sugar transport system permease subunit
MKPIIKVLLSPIVIMIDLLTWIIVGLFSCSGILFRLASSVMALMGFAVLVAYSTKNGLILLAIAFLVSPLGLPMIAVSILSGLQSISATIKNL